MADTIQLSPTVSLTASTTSAAFGINNPNPVYGLDTVGTGNFSQGLICGGTYTNSALSITGTGSYSIGAISYTMGSGSAVTGVLPNFATTVGMEFIVTNKGTTFVVTGAAPAGANLFYNTGVITQSYSVPAGSTHIILNDGNHWTVL